MGAGVVVPGQGDKAWGITDCASSVVMEERNLISALTTDDHFRQAGFRALLREATRVTAETAHGVARVSNAFALRDGRAMHHFAGVLAFGPHDEESGS